MSARNRPRLRQVDTWFVAPVALLMAAAAIALEIAYTLGRFVMTVGRLPVAH